MKSLKQYYYGNISEGWKYKDSFLFPSSYFQFSTSRNYFCNTIFKQFRNRRSMQIFLQIIFLNNLDAINYYCKNNILNTITICNIICKYYLLS